MKVKELIHILLDLDLDNEIKYLDVFNFGHEIRSVRQSEITNITWLEAEPKEIK